MELTDNIKSAIKSEYDSWFESQYADNSLEERKQLGQFYTPPEITVSLLEKLDNIDGSILDPCCGAGGLLAAAIIAGANPENIYGIELDANIVEVCRARLCKLGVPAWHIHQGDALDKRCYEFSENYSYPFPELKEVSLWF